MRSLLSSIRGQAGRETEPQPRFIASIVNDEGNVAASPETAALLREIGGTQALVQLCDAFYQKAFESPSLSKFIAEHDEPHGQRLGTWIAEKMGGEGRPWTEERAERSKCPVVRLLSTGVEHVVHDRTSAHTAAWWSAKRPASEAGQRFQIHDCRVWMRLMFWSAREQGLFKRSPRFEDWFVRFIAHFVRVYERQAPPFARESARWSLDPTNITAYRDAGNRMGPEVLGPDGQGVPEAVAFAQLPVHETRDRTGWPYTVNADGRQ